MKTLKYLIIEIDFLDSLNIEQERKLESLSDKFVGKVLRYGDKNKIAMIERHSWHIRRHKIKGC